MKNVVSVLFGQHEGSFLVGALAGAMTKSNKVGFIGGVNIPVIDSFKVGFQEGVKYTNSGAKVETTYLSLLPEFAMSLRDLFLYETIHGAFVDTAYV